MDIVLEVDAEVAAQEKGLQGFVTRSDKTVKTAPMQKAAARLF